MNWWLAFKPCHQIIDWGGASDSLVAPIIQTIEGRPRRPTEPRSLNPVASIQRKDVKRFIYALRTSLWNVTWNGRDFLAANNGGDRFGVSWILTSAAGKGLAGHCRSLGAKLIPTAFFNPSRY